MSPESRYVIPRGQEDEWVRPQSIEDLVIETVVEETSTESDQLEPLSEYVEIDSLTSIFETDGEDSISFEMEDWSVTVDSLGNVDVQS